MKCNYEDRRKTSLPKFWDNKLVLQLEDLTSIQRMDFFDQEQKRKVSLIIVIELVQERMSRGRTMMVPLKIYGPGVHSASDKNEYQKLCEGLWWHLVSAKTSQSLCGVTSCHPKDLLACIRDSFRYSI